MDKIPRKKKKEFKKKLDAWNRTHEYVLPYCFTNYEFLMLGRKKIVACVKLW